MTDNLRQRQLAAKAWQSFVWNALCVTGDRGRPCRMDVVPVTLPDLPLRSRHQETAPARQRAA